MGTRKGSSRPRPRSRKSSAEKRIVWAVCIVISLFVVIGVGWHYRNGIAYYFSFKSDKNAKMTAEQKRLADVRTVEVLTRHHGMSIGFDVSEYQGEIDWTKIDSVENLYPLDYVFIRSTAGKNKIDACFKENWEGAGKRGLIRGAYHYYRPNENSLEQAAHFILNVRLRAGDLPPVLDIEKIPENQPMDSLIVGLHRWCNAIEKHYKVAPIIYSGERYYDDFLREEFKGYVFWIANYNFFVESIDQDWMFWQFTESAEIDGIPTPVDLNIYNGPKSRLQNLRI
ncbi:glycoside hydrolase family 25 protein [Flavobacterium selenitireducens]|uniref:glycoside hydrolase family 25 protein n=1 Tax=Flavobacterium selenitireducens TaxID=2722704 RepID=UPI00168B03BA|nr:GH25 family lysozyme [Flavobacterium selenitireducens]MBD3583418.1 glycoside hydrolase family 25 protein [Flavobacterium selenitireducens]